MRRPAAPLALIAATLLASAPAGAVGLNKLSETKPWPGVTLRKYRTSSPAANAWLVIVDLCEAGVHVDATRYPKSFASAGTWAKASGAQLATNGDFFKASPTRVYGQAVGDGVAWPPIATGFDPAYSKEWYYRRAGWLAFGYDGVELNHTRHVKQNPGALSLGGWKPGVVTETFPAGTLALVSGFPELVTEGHRVTCASPTVATCFPDRSDMRARNPRTAMGITQDRGTFLLLVVDGRTQTSAGMYGTELAETMDKLGAWQAYNLDGGGSSELWREGTGYVNDYDGNNNGAGLRSVLNHWGIFAGKASGKPSRPGHCATSTPCQVIPPAGATIEDDGACFRGFGPPATWRTAAVGSGGGLHWTNATSAARPDNWAWWQLHLATAGDFDVEAFAEPAYSQFESTRYEVVADGATHPVTLDQSSASGWRKLGTFHFAAGGGQYVRVFDNNPAVAVAAGTHISADAVRLTPVVTPPTCGDGACEAPETCGGCAADCGACCGDGACGADEDCASCAADCGACEACGDGACGEGEDCATCAVDCGACDAGSDCDDCDAGAPCEGECDAGAACPDCDASAACGDCDAAAACQGCDAGAGSVPAGAAPSTDDSALEGSCAAAPGRSAPWAGAAALVASILGALRRRGRRTKAR